MDAQCNLNLKISQVFYLRIYLRTQRKIKK